MKRLYARSPSVGKHGVQGLFSVFLMASCLAAETPSPPHWTAAERLQTDRLRAAHESVEEFARQRIDLPNLGVFEDYRAVIHVHAEDSNHTRGTRAEVLSAAHATGVKVVMLTDHNGPTAETWRGLHEGVLFIAGEENGGAGFLRFPASGDSPELRFLSHVEERPDASLEGFAGMEICNRHTDAKLDRGMEEYLLQSANDPEAWRRLVESFRHFPDEVFAAGTDYRESLFAKWDRETAHGPCTGIGANDAHQNQIFQGITLDPYAVSFRNLSTHILALSPDEPAIGQALRDGHAYVAHDWLCDPTGFAFGAVNSLGVFPMGDTAVLIRGARIVGLTPLPAALRLIHGGKVVEETHGTNLVFQPKEPGAYRLEAWLKVGGEDRPWIYSNPVYLRSPSLADLQLPSNEISPEVRRFADIAYAQNGAESVAKQKLDIYSPANSPSSPVFFFIHGGAWRSGDRSQYLSIGNRFAKAGIVTVIPSYRLAPKDPHPAQIEDVAAAFAWTVAHINDYGGDTNRIYIGGHSAGGHLAALIALDHQYLAKYNVSPGLIRGVAALSGVYDLASSEGQTSVFGSDPAAREAASPLFHIAPPAPPFLITYCQWDYATLPAQARQFHAALQQARLNSDLLFIPRESHISEMVHVPRDDDPTARAIIGMITGNIRAENPANP